VSRESQCIIADRLNVRSNGTRVAAGGFAEANVHADIYHPGVTDVVGAR
jgi:hypothetical protein